MVQHLKTFAAFIKYSFGSHVSDSQLPTTQDQENLMLSSGLHRYSCTYDTNVHIYL